MAYIKVNVSYTVKNGSGVSFKAPCDCNAVAGLRVYFPDEGGTPTNKVFIFTDANGNNLTGIGHLFKKDAIVKVLLNLDEGKAYIQNADTNQYLENKFSELQSAVGGRAPASHGNHVPAKETANNARFLRNDNTWQTVTPAGIGAAPSSHTHAVSDITGVLPVAKGGTGVGSLDALATALGVPKLVVDTYTGTVAADATGSQKVELGFKPLGVIIYSPTSQGGELFLDGHADATQVSASSKCELTSTGFTVTVTKASSYSYAYAGRVFRFIAFS